MVAGAAGDLAVTDASRMAAARDGGALCPTSRSSMTTICSAQPWCRWAAWAYSYSVVLEAVPAFNLIETRDAQVWSTQSNWIRTNIRDATAYAGPRFLEIVVNPYRNQSGDRDCVVTRRDVTTAPITQDSGESGTFSTYFARLNLCGRCWPASQRCFPA